MALRILTKQKSTRITHKIITSGGTTFTVAPSDDHYDGTWDARDLYNGEIGVNTTDQKIYMRVGNNILQLYPLSGGSGITVGTTTITSGTSGAIPYNASGVYQEDASYFNWDATNHNLLVGTNSTISGFRIVSKKDVSWPSDVTSGQLVLAGATTATKRLALGYDTTNNLGFIAAGNQGVAWSNLHLQPNGGKVGIGTGTTAPAALLEIKGSSTGKIYLGELGGAATYGAIGFGSISATGYRIAGGPADAGLYLNRDTGGNIGFFENGSTSVNQMVLTTGAKLGIGISVPGYSPFTGRIHTKGTANDRQSVIVESTSSGNSAAAGFVAVNNSGNYFVAQLLGSGFSILPGSAFFYTKGADMVFGPDIDQATGGTKVLKIITGGYSNTPTITFAGGDTGTIVIGGTAQATSTKYGITWYNGTAPSANVTDGFTMWAADVAAGQSSPWFRTEDGGIFEMGTALVGWNSNTNLVLGSNNTARLTITTAGSVLTAVAGAIATNATDGFLYIPTCAGTPTGTPTAQTGMRAMVWDSTNYKLYVYDNSTWNAMN